MIKYILLLSFVVSTFLFPSAAGADHYVTPSGKGLRDGSSWANASASIQDGINAVRAGETLWIGGGTYYGGQYYSANAGTSDTNRVVWSASDDPIYGGSVTIDLNRTRIYAFSITHNYVTLKGTSNSNITLQNASTSAISYVYPAPYLKMQYVNITGTTYQGNPSNSRPMGIRGENANNMEISHGTFQNLGYGSCDSGWGGGIYLEDNCDNSLIHHNIVFNCYEGIGMVKNNQNVKIYNNICYNNWNQGICVDQYESGVNSNCEIYDNTCYDNEKGNIALWTMASTITGFKVYRNLLYYTKSVSEHYAIYLGTITGCYFYNNVMYDGGHNNSGDCVKWDADFRGIRADDGVDNNYFYNNTIFSSSTATDRGGIELYSGCSGNTFRNNVIYVNSPNGYAVSMYGTNPQTFSNNSYYVPNGTYPFYRNGNVSWSTWQSQTGDSDSLVGNPDFVNVADLPDVSDRTRTGLTLRSSSPCRDAGRDLSGVFTDDFLKLLRPQELSWDIGAYEFTNGDKDPPQPPQGVEIIK